MTRPRTADIAAATGKTPRCGATTRAGHPCIQVAGWGIDHVGHGRCKLHGGASPAGRKQAHRQAAELAARTYGIPLDVDPIEGLMQEVRRTAGHVAWLEAEIGALDKDALTRATRYVRRTSGGPNGDLTVTEAGVQINPLIELYHRERTQLVKVCAVVAQHGVDQLALELEQRAIGEIVGVLRLVLDDLHLTPEQQALVPQVLPQRLRSIKGGKVA